MKPALLENFALSRTVKIFHSLRATTWTDPKVVYAELCMPDKQDSVVIFDNNASGDSMFHIKHFKVPYNTKSAL